MSKKPSWLFRSVEITAPPSAVFSFELELQTLWKHERIRRKYIAKRQKNTELKRKELGFSINGRIVDFFKDD